MNSVKTSKMGLWMGVVAAAMSASSVLASDHQDVTAEAQIGNGLIPGAPDRDLTALPPLPPLPPPPPQPPTFNPPIPVNPGTPGIYEPPAPDPEPPVLTAELVIQQAAFAMWTAVNSQALSTIGTYTEIMNAVNSSGAPASKQTIASARSQYQSHSKVAQAQIKSIQVQAAAQLRVLGASKDQRKELSVVSKAYRAQSKEGVRVWHEHTQALGAL